MHRRSKTTSNDYQDQSNERTEYFITSYSFDEVDSFEDESEEFDSDDFEPTKTPRHSIVIMPIQDYNKERKAKGLPPITHNNRGERIKQVIITTPLD